MAKKTNPKVKHFEIHSQIKASLILLFKIGLINQIEN